MKIEKEIILNNKLGLHARPAAMFVQIANKFKSEIYLTKDNQTVNGKSVLGILTLAAEHGSILNLQINGPDASEMLKHIEGLFANNFGEI
ncbi:HPr family phosphocarrier protein [Candidatus Poribacteria bacterium]|nr:HPr family phosphocarrier protein [Candidatus Poribacteria bacterium]